MSLTFNGHDLTTLFSCGDPEITILDAHPDTREVSGRNGAAFIGMTYGVATVAFTIAAIGDAATRRGSFSTLGQWLKVDEPKALVLPDTSDRYYLAVPSGALGLTRGIDVFASRPCCIRRDQDGIARFREFCEHHRWRHGSDIP